MEKAIHPKHTGNPGLNEKTEVLSHQISIHKLADEEKKAFMGRERRYTKTMDAIKHY